MTEEKGRRNMGEIRHEYYEDEINLFDYLLVLWKWKWLIIGGTLICAIVAAIISLQMPKSHVISMAIEPGVIGLDDKGNKLYMDSKEIIGKINDGRYNRDIEKSMDKASLSASLTFKASAVKYTNLIAVDSSWGENDLDSGLTASRQLTVMLSEDYKNDAQIRKADIDKRILINQEAIKKVEEERKDINAELLATKQKRMKIIKTENKEIDMQIILKNNEIRKIEIKRKDIDKQVTLKLSDINRKKNQISMHQDTLIAARQRIDELIMGIKSIKDNTEQIVAQRDMLLKEKRAEADISLLIYANTIQQNLAYFNQLNAQVYNLRLSDKKEEEAITKLNSDSIDLKIEIERLELHQKDGLQIDIDKIKAEIEKLERMKSAKLHQQNETVKTEAAKEEKQKKEGLDKRVDTINTKIDEMYSEKEIISNIRLVRQPEASSVPVKSSRGRKIILLSGVVALFMFVFLAFFIEYIRNARREYGARKGQA